MATSTKQKDLLKLFADITNKTKIVEPMKKIHGTLRDQDAVEREIALIMREILDRGYFKTKLEPIQLARLISLYHVGKNDTEIARSLGDEKLSKTVARARVRLKLFRDLDFKMPFDPANLDDLIAQDLTMKDISERLGISPSTLREYRHVLDEQKDTTLDPYLERIRDVMEDRDLSEQMTLGVTRDSLGDSIDISEAEMIDLS
ncbi:MAG: response regulator receiver protein [Methanocalculus sp.]|uniref:response regulator receiver protein n=1 Tax=Methanocalculus sp. TaxID=2004547 RepID=UPI00271FB493|nr:response regulator receiver protein [Methanocalculus sp.]MDO8841252.1 response regulator receiver protein [Methanocalculus sp.]MDO9539508.1 response regulator receiver protein [Methanocalculus sp.]